VPVYVCARVHSVTLATIFRMARVRTFQHLLCRFSQIAELRVLFSSVMHNLWHVGHICPVTGCVTASYVQEKKTKTWKRLRCIYLKIIITDCHLRCGLCICPVEILKLGFIVCIILLIKSSAIAVIWLAARVETPGQLPPQKNPVGSCWVSAPKNC